MSDNETKTGKFARECAVKNNYKETLTTGFPLFRSRDDKKNRGATMYAPPRKKHSQFLVTETGKSSEGRREE